MQAEKFYKEIQEKIEKSDFEPTWNKADVWQRIEQKNTKKKPLIVWWKAAAASVALIGAIGIFFAKNNNQTTDNQIVAITTPTTKTQTNVPTLSKSIQSIAVQTKGVSQGFSKAKTLVETPTDAAVAKIATTENLESINPEKQEVAINQEQATPINESNLAENNIETAVKETRFIPNQALIEARVPRKRERVAILEIPEDNYESNSADREKKKGYLTRLTKKKGKNKVEENDELPSINGKPNKVWAFVKESFKNETMSVDSTNK